MSSPFTGETSVVVEFDENKTGHEGERGGSYQHTVADVEVMEIAADFRLLYFKR